MVSGTVQKAASGERNELLATAPATERAEDARGWRSPAADVGQVC